MNIQTIAVVQARLGSSRFPRKVLADIAGTPALLFLLRRLARAELVDEIVVALPTASSDDELESLVCSWGYRAIRGPEHDVLARFLVATLGSTARWTVRVTGDCPLIDPLVVDRAISQAQETGAHYVALSESCPDGLDVEVFPTTALLVADVNSHEPGDREHVTPWIRRNAQLAVTLDCVPGAPSGRVTLDEPDDLVVINNVVSHFGRDDFSATDVVSLMSEAPDLFTKNEHLARNEGALMGSGEKLWRRALRVIPDGNMLLSKRPQQFTPTGWPTYFSSAKGCEVVDLDGRRFYDLSLMGVGTNILGYGHEAVDDAVRAVVDSGNMSTLNGPEEVELAERLCAAHPWAQMAKFARSGGEACAIAVRIARAAVGKSAVAICGYHGWHDWYLSANLADDAALDGHLLAGLEPRGVPRDLHGLTRPFFYNDLTALERILSSGDVGVVMMEVERSSPPEEGFLEGVRSLTRSHGAVLIFDECTSGFRRAMGGLHLDYGVAPDIATFGKTLGNGYAISAVIGSEAVMSAARKTFISSTFWTERIGSAAALAALDAMESEGAPAAVDRIGRGVREIWKSVAAGHSLDVRFGGLPALTSVTVVGWNVQGFRERLVAGMLAEGFLAGTAVYASLAHTPAILERYGEALERVLGVIQHDPPMDDPQAGESSPSYRGFGRLA